MGNLWEEFLGASDLIELARSPGLGWRYQAARALLACDPSTATHDPLGGSHQATFFSAADDWLRGNDAAALDKLNALPSLGAARELARLIAKDRIDVVSFLPRTDRAGMHNLADVALYDQKFALRNVSSTEGDVINRPDLSIIDLTRDQETDFVLAEMIEWHMLPRDLQRFAGPIIGHTSDFDLHIQGCLPYFRSFDFVMTAGRQEWQKLAGLIGRERTQPFPLPFSLPDIPARADILRDIDFVMTGTVFAPSQRDKERLVKDIISYPGLNYTLCNGSITIDHYWALLRSSRLTTCFIRHADSMPTRALEALAAGCTCLLAPDSALNLYVPEGHGLIPMDQSDLEDLHRKIRAVTRDEVERFAAEAARGNDLVRKLFAKPRICSVYMRFCTVLAALIAAGDIKRRPAPLPLTQKRPISWVGWLPANGDKDKLEEIRLQNRALALQATEREPYWRLNEVGRDAILDYELRTRRQRHTPDRALVKEALDAFRGAITANPDALVPAVNFVRAAYHHGDAAERCEADALAASIVSRPRASWTIRPEDDLLTYDFHQTHADTRRFIDLITDWESGTSEIDTVKSALTDALLATVHLYLGWRNESVESYRAAFALAPRFIEIRVGLARALVETGEIAAALEARDHLAEVAADHIFSTEIPALAARAGRLLSQPTEETPLQADLDYRCLDYYGEYFTDFEGVVHATTRRFAETATEIRRRPAPRSPALSVIVLDRHRDRRTALAALDQQNRDGDGSIELIDCEAFASIGDSPPDWCDVAVRPNAPAQLIEHRGRILTLGFREASAEILVFAERLEGLSLEHLNAAASAVQSSPETLAAKIWLEAGAPRAQILALSRELFLQLEGFDLSVACQGPRGGVHELVWRARNRGYKILDLGQNDLPTAIWASELSLSSGRLKPIATLLKMSDKPNWDDPSRIRPFWPAKNL